MVSSAEEIRNKISSLNRSGVWVPETQTQRMTKGLAEIIQTEYADQPVPVLSFLSRGGWNLQTKITSLLGIHGSEIAQIGLDRDGDSFTVGQPPTEDQVQGKDVLLIDAVSRSGDKLVFADKLVRDLGARSVRSAVLLDTISNDTDRYHPDLACYAKPSDTYYSFPWEWSVIVSLRAQLEAIEQQTQDQLASLVGA